MENTRKGGGVGIDRVNMHMFF